VLVGIGFLAKGPVILVLYGGTLFFTWLLSRERVPFRELRLWRGLALILAIGVPWFAYMAVRFRELDFLGQYFGHYTFGRVSGTIGRRGWLFYPRILLGDAMPALAVLPFAAVIAWRKRSRAPAAVLPWVGMLWIVLFFSFSAGKRNVYMMPLYPLLAVAVAPLLDAVWRGASRGGVRLGGSAAAFGCWAGAVLLFLLQRNAPALAPEIWWPISMLLVVSVPLLVAGVRGAGRVLVVGSFSAVFLLYTAVALTFPALARFRPVPEIAARVLQEQSTDDAEPMVIHAVSIHSMNYYLGRATHVSTDGADLLEKMGSAQSAFVLVAAHDFDAPPRAAGGPRRGLKNDGTGLTFTELLRRPLLTFRFERSILGRGSTTKDLLLLRASRPVSDRSPSGTGGTAEGSETAHERAEGEGEKAK
jgi:4-amino-4-deoxy-L-arabinose transferase-like glycosyltransferase